MKSVLGLLLLLQLRHVLGKVPPKLWGSSTSPGRPRSLDDPPEVNHTVTVEEYVALVEQRDQDGGEQQESDTNSEEKTAEDAAPAAAEPSEEEAAAVGLKIHGHSSSNDIKSNAVGDPDGEGSDDDDDDDHEEDTDDFTEDWEDLDDVVATSEVQMELEVVENQQTFAFEDMDASEEHEEVAATTAGGGGVGVRLGQRLSSRRRKEWPMASSSSTPNTTIHPVQSDVLLNIWSSQVYLPPAESGMDFLRKHARLWDSASRLRLDRRTLYACLMLEHEGFGSNWRRFLDASTRQALHAALSMATQPKWRKVSPRSNGIRLYDDDEMNQSLAMQETLAMALAHSMGAGFVVLDDSILSNMRQQLLSSGYGEENVKPAFLLKSLLEMARDGKLQSHSSGSIAACMKRDLEQEVDDPFDERVNSSVQEMEEWEAEWKSGTDDCAEESLPLVIFLRTHACTSLLRSKSAVELLIQECTSDESTSLVVLGKGINSRTTSLPQESINTEGMELSDTPVRSATGAPPMFGFPPNNQNASGQNDPEGSRRFNIFLARTIDPKTGAHGILGAVAPPQAGNLFPQMMAMQAKERMESQENMDPQAKADMERWVNAFQQHMQQANNKMQTPTQFFNASLSESPFKNEISNTPPPSPEVIQQTMQQAMSAMLDRLAQMEEDGESSSELPSDLHKAFAQVLRNDNLRRAITENLARAAPALADSRCQGIMMSIYVPPSPHHANAGKLPGPPTGRTNPQLGGWFQKILSNQDESGNPNLSDAQKENSRQKRIRTMAAASAAMMAKGAQDTKEGEKQENKADRNLARLEQFCRPVSVPKPADPVRAKSWDAWITREQSAVIFRHNRRALNDQLRSNRVSLKLNAGTNGAGSVLRQMLSVKDISDDMEDIVKTAIELEASKAQLHRDSPASNEEKADLTDETLSQILMETNKVDESKDAAGVALSSAEGHLLHPTSLETALTMITRISPSSNGGVSLPGGSASHRTKEEILALAQDKHERALVSQVVSPQEIGVTYDMIGGLSEVKELLRQSITYPLKFPHLYSEGIAREAVKGVLLFGPPGTGKTMLAKAVATEGGASFLSVDASSVENKWLGESEKNAKAVFTLARRLAPCVVFIDEVDSLLSSREGSSDDSAHGTLTSVKTTMMSEWDGLKAGTNGAGEAGSDRVIVIGSTNRPFDLDEAVLRRFPRRILVDLPDLETRAEILEVTLAENRVHPSVNLTEIAERLEGYTGSDIKEVCREAVVQISHEQARMLDQGYSNDGEGSASVSSLRLRPVTMDDFESALGKLKRSVSDKGRELARVWEWNDEYGELKKDSKNHLSHIANMYI